jgi:selenocysteine lyase/cysteine desulfurase
VRNTTEGVTTVLLNWPLERGDEILTSSAEHGPFYDTLAQRAARDGVTIRRFHYPAPARSLNEIVDAIDRALSPRTRLVMIGQVVLTGQINPNWRRAFPAMRASRRGRRDAVNVLPLEQHAAAERWLQTGERSQQRRLAGAVWAAETDQLASFQGR